MTVCPVTSTELDAPLLRVSVTADANNGLDRDSFLMVEFERRLLVFLGFGA